MYPFQIIAMDHIPSLPRSHKGNTELLIWIDLFTGYLVPAMIHGVSHFFQVATLEFPSNHIQIRMVRKVIYRLDPPVRHKVPVPLRLLEHCFNKLNLSLLSGQAIWGCLSFFFLLRRSEIVSFENKISWFALKASDAALLNSSGIATAQPQ
ncbi:hypothetical protein PHMEG_00034366 [Phytophthora megakarya]|uniref:Uncharacterized protein n=1 Tax=Phytophthora megakarya TaxID=4795 RepID=A0A225UR66_9STRA|nr:hypothetical protein PHMEG_00034366 [Phytophthora megakarya]